jgi:hypothetical protein
VSQFAWLDQNFEHQVKMTSAKEDMDTIVACLQDMGITHERNDEVRPRPPAIRLRMFGIREVL